MKPDFPAISVLLFLGITAFVFVMIVQALVKSLRGIQHPNYTGVLYMSIMGMLTWLTVTMVLAKGGFFANFDTIPPRFPILLIVPLATTLILAFLKVTPRMLTKLSPHSLIYIQAIRIPVEIVLWMLFLENICPVQMTFEGMNFDILAGLTAPIVGFVAFGQGRKHFKLAIVWNVAGMLLLLNIIGIAILSTPFFAVLKPENTFIAHWPLVWLAAFVAPFALATHLFSLIQLVHLKKAKK